MRRVVVLRALGLGDFLAAVPAYRAIRRAFPASRIVLAAPRVLAPLAALAGGAIDEVADAAELAPLPRDCHDADVGIDLHGCGPASHRVLLAARPRRFVAFRHPAVPESADGAPFDPREHEVARWCRLVAHAGMPADPDALDLDVPGVTVPRAVRGATLLHAGAASEARRWPVDRWIATARAERARGRAVVLTGGADERDRALAIARGAGIAPRFVYAGRTSLRELAALVAAAGRVICGDTGVAHLATAYRRPSVVLFGPTSPEQWGPPPRPHHRVLWAGTTGDPHAASVDAGLLAIAPADAIAALAALDDAAPVTARTFRATA